MNLQNSQKGSTDALGELFAEEVGLVIEVADSLEEEILSEYRNAGLQACSIGRTTEEPSISISINSETSISGKTHQSFVFRLYLKR